MKQYRYRISQIRLDLDEAESRISVKIKKKVGPKAKGAHFSDIRIIRKSIDARHKDRIRKVYTVDFTADKKLPLDPAPDMTYRRAEPGTRTMEHRPVIVGFGPCGMFCALVLAQQGYRPLIIERGQRIEDRVRAVEHFWKTGELDPENNVQFGEGGAGTFSDGKLTTGIKDPRIRFVLEEFVRAGADEDILYEQKPHIGTDHLRRIVNNIRDTIEELGGEIWYGTRLEHLQVKADHESEGARATEGARETKGEHEPGCASETKGARVCGIVVSRRNSGAGGSGTEIKVPGISESGTSESKIPETEIRETEVIKTENVVLAIGHSARDTFRNLKEDRIAMQQKPFSIGVRIEHPQDAVDRAQYGAAAGQSDLGAASYKLSWHCENGRGVYTFCMCPGGEVINASSVPGMAVTNGMSLHDRDSGMANSGLLVDVRTSDFDDPGDPLSGIDFQERYERAAFRLGGGEYSLPKTTWGEFRDGRGTAGRVMGCLPGFAIAAIREAMPNLGKKLAGFDADDAVMTGVETRSSSPVRILRDKKYMGSVQGLYPGGEGAGYAGGIMSSACDGIRIAEEIISRFRVPEKALPDSEMER